MHNERVTLDLTDNFTSRLPQLEAAAKAMTAEMARKSATWEPHDWDDFAS